MSDFETFRSSFTGDILTPDDPGYDQAIARWAKNAARRAAVVAFVKDAEDVSKAIRYAKQAKLPIAIKGGGHNPSGASSSEGGLVIDLSRYLNEAKIDPEKRLAYVGGGATWETVDKAAIQHGLATVGGTVNHVRLLVLGGGYGWLSAAYGLAIDNLVQATVVTADGAVRTANETENADLFWGIRGAGSNFGVVTEFVLKLHPQRRTVFAGLAIFSPDTLDALLDVTQQWWDEGPSEKEGMIQAFTRGPDHQPCVVCFIFYNGSEEEGRQNYKAFFDLKPVADVCKEMPYEELNTLQNAVATPGQTAYMKGAFAPQPFPRTLLPHVFTRLVSLSAPATHTVALLMEYFPLRAANAVPDGATAYRRGLAPNVLCVVYAREDGEGAWAYARDVARELTGMFAEGAGKGKGDDLGYGNYSPDSDALPAEGSVSADKAALLFGSNYPRLQQLKAKYDPERVFNKWFTITPLPA
ncbi:FAD-binding domain-containing protein [Trametes coccinea BRFM310]|uniref:FAD-binding domain-containing protein n=1 Tax=Trametes coccinea (strain BRFM310) TaxID=1353009 RepID=A0A1Y2IEB3_TRAC3|nr:FAD-binding domain-containing protein [Trametes coccinea BRFM310]